VNDLIVLVRKYRGYALRDGYFKVDFPEVTEKKVEIITQIVLNDLLVKDNIKSHLSNVLKMVSEDKPEAIGYIKRIINDLKGETP